MIRYIIFRHGEAGQKISVHHKTPLTVRGQKQAHKLGNRLIHFNVSGFYTSPLMRARQTAEIVNEYLDLDLIVDSRLQEVGSYRMFHEYIDMENEGALVIEDFNKAQLGIASFFSEQKKTNDDKTILISSHGNLIKAMLAITVGITDNDALNRLIIGNTGLTVLEWLRDDDYQLVVFNDTNHLGELIFR